MTEGERLLSAYHKSTGNKFWIITEHDNSATLEAQDFVQPVNVCLDLTQTDDFRLTR